MKRFNLIRQLQTWFYRGERRLPLPANESGQSIIILTFAFLGMLAMLGIALDLGLVYVERIKLKRTVDAAALAGVSELPTEEEAVRRAIEYIGQNGYDVEHVRFYVAGCVQDLAELEAPAGATDLVNYPAGYNWATLPMSVTLPISSGLFYPYINGDLPDDEPRTSFYIDMHSFSRENAQGCDEGEPVNLASTVNFGSSSKIKVYGEVPVRMSFMQFFGFPEVVISDEATAENASTLDVAVVFDVTSSMELDTICFDCWRRCDQLPAGRSCGTDNKFTDYPQNGRALHYDYNSPRMVDLRSADPLPVLIDVPGGKRPFIIIEAEFYTNNTSIWDPALRTANMGYWALQRTFNTRAYSIDGFGYQDVADDRVSGFVRHHPFVATEGDMGRLPFGKHYALADAVSDAAPRLDYDFIPTWGSGQTTYIHLRVQAFKKGDYGTSAPYNEFFWAIGAPGVPGTSIKQAQGGPINGSWRTEDNWDWITLNAGNLSNARHTLNIWAGSTGYSIDRIVITNQSTINNDIRRREATPGSAQGMAADKCNPIFGLQVAAPDCTSGYITLPNFTVNNLNDPLFGDWQPYRGASEAVKAFIARLNPRLDQAGLVTFVTNSTQRAQLECLRAAQVRAGRSGTQVPNYPAAVPGVEYDERACYENAVTGTKPISYNNVFIELEKVRDTNLEGGTNIASGLRRGLHMLGLDTDGDVANRTHQNDCNWTRSGSTWRIGGVTQPNSNIESHCGRGQAATPIIVLLTDGSPTKPGSSGDSAAWAGLDNTCDDWSGPDHPAPYPEFDVLKDDPKYECIMYYADMARRYGVIIYVIGLGNGVDHDLLQAVAEMTSGQYYYAPSPVALNAIFDEILVNVYISLVR